MDGDEDEMATCSPTRNAVDISRHLHMGTRSSFCASSSITTATPTGSQEAETVFITERAAATSSPVCLIKDGGV